MTLNTCISYVPGRLTEAEISQVGDALWNEKYTPEDSLPENTDIYDWAFLEMPEPLPGVADRAFRRKWLSIDFVKVQNRAPSPGEVITVSSPNKPTNPASLDDTLWNVGFACSSLRRSGGKFEFSSEERKRIMSLFHFGPGPMSRRTRFLPSAEMRHVNPLSERLLA